VGRVHDDVLESGDDQSLAQHFRIRDLEFEGRGIVRKSFER
jgi:hypothetical protein